MANIKTTDINSIRAESVYQCPVCKEVKSINIIDIRAGYNECRSCGFEDIVEVWDRNKRKSKYIEKRDIDSF